MKSKIYDSPAAALEGVLFDGMTIMSGGFGLSGNPESLIPEVRASGVGGLTVISNNAGADGFGLWMLLDSRQVRKMIASYVGENKLFEQQYLSGELELELNPQGTLAERIRAGGAGIPAFYTRTGVGTVVAEGKPVETFDGEEYVRETWLRADLSIVKAWRADPAGNLMFRKTARNFNPVIATAGKMTVVEVEEIVPAGTISSTSTTVTFPAVAIVGLKLRAVLRNIRLPAGSARHALMIDRSARSQVSRTYASPSNVSTGLPSATTVPTPVLVKKAGMPAPPARIRSASVPCGVSSSARSPDRYCSSNSLFSPT